MTRKSGLILLSLLAFAACGDGATDPTDDAVPTLNADVAAAVADGVGEDVATMRDLNFGLRTGFIFLSPEAAPWGDCPWNSSSGWHECETREIGPLTIERRYAFYDAGGAAQEEYDASLTASILTASIRAQREVGGSFERATDEGRSPPKSITSAT